MFMDSISISFLGLLSDVRPFRKAFSGSEAVSELRTQIGEAIDQNIQANQMKARPLEPRNLAETEEDP